MNKEFFLNHALFWSFCTSILFIIGSIGYLFMDLIDYLHIYIFTTLITNIIYILLASISVVNTTLQFFVIYNMNRNTQKYYTMILSCIFDKIGSYAYLLAAILTTVIITHTNLIWAFSAIGVCGFVLGATINLMIPSTSYTCVWADCLNLLGSLSYLMAMITTRIPVAQMILILGDIIYLIDSFLYMICWFQDRKWTTVDNKQYMLFK